LMFESNTLLAPITLHRAVLLKPIRMPNIMSYAPKCNILASIENLWPCIHHSMPVTNSSEIIVYPLATLTVNGAAFYAE
jgi:hypothetical protein